MHNPATSPGLPPSRVGLPLLRGRKLKLDELVQRIDVGVAVRLPLLGGRKFEQARLTDMTDRYPMDVGQDSMAPMVMRLNVANLYNYLTGA